MIYLDSAATSILKPPEVAEASARAMGSMASPGRGGHGYAAKAADKVYECRENVAKLCGVEKCEQVVFTFNATHGLNIAIGSLAKGGMRALVSGYEHNSVMRPLRAMGVECVSPGVPLFDSDAFLDEAGKMMDRTDIVICSYVSNVFGWVFPIYELGELCRKKGKAFIVDASQAAGVQDIDFSAMEADFVAFPGHKGLMGPQGTGVLICKNEAKPLLYGGSGSDSLLPGMPEYLPDRLEAGTANVCGIAGLNEGVKYLLRRGVKGVRRHERMLLEEFCCPLAEVEGLELFYCPMGDRQSSVVSLRHRVLDCGGIESAMTRAGVALRSGLHCAPAAHESGGTIDTGTARFSFFSVYLRRTSPHGLVRTQKNFEKSQ